MRDVAVKAAVYRTYGPPDVVRIEEVLTPVPRDHEVLIRIRASTISSGDSRVRSLQMPRGFGLFARTMFGLRATRQPTLGTELSGTVAVVGRGVTRFRVGDDVFAFPGVGMGCHAEYRTMPEDGLVEPIPAGLSFEQAAALSFGGTTALYFLRDRARVRAGEDVLVVGASGAVGSAAVQLARHLGARVTGVTSTGNVACVRGLGAHRVIDYTAEVHRSRTETYDVVLDTVGQASLSAYASVLKAGGRLVLVAASLPQMIDAWCSSMTRSHRVIAGPARERAEDLQTLKRLAEAGAFAPLVERCYPFEQIVAAHAYVETGRKPGSVVIVMDPPGT